jgi:hypothetical protein
MGHLAHYESLFQHIPRASPDPKYALSTPELDPKMVHLRV